MAQWIPAFFMRVHGASAKQAGIYFGMSGGAGSAVGALLGALIAPTLIRKDRRWELWLPGVAYAMAVPCLAFVFISQTMQAAAVFLFVGMTIASTGMGAGMASVQSVAEPQLRATAVALLTLCSALIGQGAGPVLVGVASDALAAHFGPQSLRVALLVSIVLVALGASQFFRAARSLPTDLVS